MNQHIPKSGNSRPGNFRIFLSQNNREPLSGFRQFLEFAERGFASLPISQKYIAPLGVVILDSFNALKNMVEINPLVLHNGVASCKTRSRNSL